jgi:3-oxoacyl-[acyl-carrier protein] reductase
MDMKGHCAIVTGSSAGVGAATALLLARRGASVLVNCTRSQDAAEVVAAQCRAASGADAFVVSANVASDDDCRRMAQAAQERWGRIDYLVNNAGTTKFVAANRLGGLSAQDFHDIYAVNTIGVFQMVRACEAALRASGGAVVNVSSIAGQEGQGSSIAYAASKGALNTLTIALARVLGPQARVNAVLPGFIETGWLQAGLGEAYEASRQAYKDGAALEQVLTPEDVADSIVWLLSATKVTGQLLRVDGGRQVGKLQGRPAPRAGA